MLCVLSNYCEKHAEKLLATLLATRGPELFAQLVEAEQGHNLCNDCAAARVILVVTTTQNTTVLTIIIRPRQVTRRISIADLVFKGKGSAHGLRCLLQMARGGPPFHRGPDTLAPHRREPESCHPASCFLLHKTAAGAASRCLLGPASELCPCNFPRLCLGPVAYAELRSAADQRRACASS